MTLTSKKLARALRAFSGALWPSDEGLVFRYVLAESIVAAVDAFERPLPDGIDGGVYVVVARRVYVGGVMAVSLAQRVSPIAAVAPLEPFVR